MRVVCLLLKENFERRRDLAEACLAFTPQIALGSDAIFLEIEGTQNLFSPEECIQRLKEVLEIMNMKGNIAIAPSLGSALAFARFQKTTREELPIEALADYLSPFTPQPFLEAELFRKLGVLTIGDFLRIPRSQLSSRFGKSGLLAYERLLEASRTAWPRFQPTEKIEERVSFDFAAQIETFEPVLFLLKTALHRVFLRLYARREKLAALNVKFHLNRFSAQKERVSEIKLPLPQSEMKGVLQLASERLQKELELYPLPEALEGISLLVTDTAPFRDTQRDLFSKVEEERETWSALVGRLTERLGSKSAFLACPSPRLLPEASWQKTLDESLQGTLVQAPIRPLRLLSPPQPLQRLGEWLITPEKKWRLTQFTGPERLEGEWWLGGFEREYFRVHTESGESLWVFTAPSSVKSGSPRSLWLHGFFD